MAEIKFETAGDLWDFIDPRNNLGYKEHEELVFRGQADSTWNLEPSVFRGSNNPGRIFLGSGPIDSQSQVAGEFFS